MDSAPKKRAYTKSRLIKELAFRAGISQRQSRAALEAIIEIAYREAKANFFILPGLCKFDVVRRAPRNVRNPMTGEKLVLPERDALRVVLSKRAKETVAPRVAPLTEADYSALLAKKAAADESARLAAEEAARKVAEEAARRAAEEAARREAAEAARIAAEEAARKAAEEAARQAAEEEAARKAAEEAARKAAEEEAARKAAEEAARLAAAEAARRAAEEEAARQAAEEVARVAEADAARLAAEEAARKAAEEEAARRASEEASRRLAEEAARKVAEAAAARQAAEESARKAAEEEAARKAAEAAAQKEPDDNGFIETEIKGDRAISFKCTTCGQEIIAPDEAVGYEAECPACGAILLVPQSSEPGTTYATDGSGDCPYASFSVAPFASASVPSVTEPASENVVPAPTV